MDNHESHVKLYLAGESMIPEGIRLIEEVMGNHVEFRQWDSEKTPLQYPPLMSIACHKNKVVSAVIMYPCRLQISEDRFEKIALGGQMCVEPRFRKNGLTFDILTWSEDLLNLNNISFYKVTAGTALYRNYYRNNLGFVRTEGEIEGYFLRHPRKMAEKFCKKTSDLIPVFPMDIVVDISDPIFGPCWLIFDGSGSRVEMDCELHPHLSFKGPVWAVFDCFLNKTGRKILIKSIVSGRLKLKGMFAHPIRTFYLLKIFRIFFKFHHGSRQDGKR
jgi:hypothetical protein